MLKKIFFTSTVITATVVGAYLFSPFQFHMPGDSASYNDYIEPASKELIIKSNLKRHIQMFSDTIGERNVFTGDSLKQSAKYIENEFNKANLQIARQKYHVESTEVFNIIGEKTGTDKAAEVIIIGGHYDSITNSKGANDNASGIAAVIELAHLLKDTPTRHTIRFVGFVNEEPPFFQTDEMGSLVYARSLQEKNEKIAGMISVETIGAYYNIPDSQNYPAPLNLLYPSTGNFIAFVGNPASKDFFLTAIDIFRNETGFPSEGLISPDDIPGVGWSDHWSFWQTDFPAIMVTDTALYRYQHYHTEDDTIDKLNLPAMTQVVAGLANVITKLDNRLQ